ncbi:MAG: 16S rRNA (uracil(1498)-N(3))-methyltransferase [Bacteroidota bacterium]
MHIFYQPDIDRGIYYLDEEESKHCIRVLRFSEGDIIHIIDGRDFFYKARITDPNQKKCEFEIIEREKRSSKDYHIHIAISPTKNAERIEWFVEKATEIGVDEISFLYCDNSERKYINLQRLQKKALAATKQSQQCRIPIINQIKTFKDFILSVEFDHTDNFIAYVDKNNWQVLSKVAKPNRNYCMLIGPEGDFSAHELEQADQKGFEQISLGPNTLRTETAGVAACHVLNILNY